MRILVVSDLHYRLPHYDWLVEAAADVDAVALVGDLADVVSPVPHDVQTVVLTQLPGPAGRATAGPRRLRQPRPRRPRCARRAGRLLAARGSRRIAARGRDQRRRRRHPVHGVPLVGRPGDPRARSAPSSPRRPSTGPRAGSGSTTRRRRARRCATTGGATFPDHELADWIAEHQPDVVLCGHIHQAPWATGGSWHARLGDTWVFNAGKQIGKVPPHITLDTEARDRGLVRRVRVGDARLG